MEKVPANKNRSYKYHKHTISFINAYNGILYAFKTQPNYRYHSLFLVLLVINGFVYRIDYYEWLAVILTSAFIFMMEMFNTSIEVLGDVVSKKKYNKLVGIAKDVSAGGVLVAAIFALIVAVVVFAPKIVLGFQGL